MSAQECELTELPPDQCACRNHRGGSVANTEQIETVGQSFEAQYSGPCAGCERGIREGDEIARVADVASEYVHARGCPR